MQKQKLPTCRSSLHCPRWLSSEATTNSWKRLSQKSRSYLWIDNSLKIQLRKFPTSLQHTKQYQVIVTGKHVYTLTQCMPIRHRRRLARSTFEPQPRLLKMALAKTIFAVMQSGLQCTDYTGSPTRRRHKSTQLCKMRYRRYSKSAAYFEPLPIDIRQTAARHASRTTVLYAGPGDKV